MDVFDVVGLLNEERHPKLIERVLRLAFEVRAIGEPYTCSAYMVAAAEPDHPAPVMRLYAYGAPKNAIDFPVSLDADACGLIVSRWLAACERGPKPDTDGHSSEGFRVFIGPCCGHEICSVEPYWIVYGK